MQEGKNIKIFIEKNNNNNNDDEFERRDDIRMWYSYVRVVCVCVHG
mgnify:CR=1 FL=1